MIKQLRIFGTLLMLISLLAFKCKNDSYNDDCRDKVCTTEFRMITVDIKDGQNNPAVLDKVETYLNGVLVMTSTEPSIPMSSSYTIADDSFLQQIGYNSSTFVTFKIYKNNQLVKTADYEIKTDCCHIDKISGDGQIIIN